MADLPTKLDLYQTLCNTSYVLIRIYDKISEANLISIPARRGVG
jgi:hypothetical protein